MLKLVKWDNKDATTRDHLRIVDNVIDLDEG
jgi:hypothetical protein